MFPFLDLKTLHDSIRTEIDMAISRVLEHQKFINGPELKTFEYRFADFCGTNYSVPCANGTVSLHAILENIGVGPGDEVICPSHTFMATVEAIRLAGATPVFAEIREDTMLIDPEHVKTLIRSRTKAIIPVHLYGNVCDIDGLRAAIGDRDIAIVEDAAQAHGATYKGKRAGGLGVAGSFSFFPGKNLGAFGDAGAITTNDQALHELMKRYVNHGRAEKYEHTEIGTNYRMDTLQAAILLVKLRYLKEWNKTRRRVAKRYDEILSGEPFKSHPVLVQRETPGAESVYHLYVIRVPNRDAVAQGLKERGVETGLHYPIPCHLQPALKKISPGEGALLKTEKVCNTLLSLPMGPTMTDDHVEAICNILRVVLLELGAPKV